MKHPMHPTEMVGESYAIQLIDAAFEDENGELPGIIRVATDHEGGDSYE